MSDKRPRGWAGFLRLQGVDIPEHFCLISERVVFSRMSRIALIGFIPE